MRRLSFSAKSLLCLVMLTSGAAAVARAQDGNNPDVLKKELAETLAQLKAAQDRKSELATENEKLKQQMAALQKEVDETRRAQSAWGEQTYALRAHRQAWDVFVARHPHLRAQWELFLELGPVVAENEMPTWGTTEIPATTQAATQPSSTTTTSAPSGPATAEVVMPPTTTTAPTPRTEPTTTTGPASSNSSGDK